LTRETQCGKAKRFESSAEEDETLAKAFGKIIKAGNVKGSPGRLCIWTSTKG